jgi:nitrogen regulatory protein PII
MKKIEAVISSSSLHKIQAEFARRGVCGNLTVTQVLHGETHAPSNRATANSRETLNEGIKIELIVSDRQIDKAVNVILRHAITESSYRYGHVALLNADEILQITQPIQGPTPG